MFRRDISFRDVALIFIRIDEVVSFLDIIENPIPVLRIYPDKAFAPHLFTFLEVDYADHAYSRQVPMQITSTRLVISIEESIIQKHVSREGK